MQPRAVKYRQVKHHWPVGHRRELPVDGVDNMGDDSGTGVFHSQSATGENKFYGEF